MDITSGSFQEGISKVSNEGTEKNTSFFHAYGLVMTNERKLENIKGIGKVTNLPESLPYVGHLSAGQRLYLWLGQGSSSQIGYIEDDTYTTLVYTPTLAFDPLYKVTAKSISEKIIVWTDDLNPVRYMNVETASLVTDASDFNLSLPTRFYEYYTKIRTGGSLPSGKFFFTYAYVTESGTVTNYMMPSQEYDLHDVDLQGVPLVQNASYIDVPRNKRLEITLAQTDQRYVAIQPAVLYYTTASHVLKAVTLPQVSIVGLGSGSIQLNISTLSNSTPVDPTELLISTVQYETARTLHVFNNTLFLGGVEQKGLTDTVALQQIANTVVLRATRHLSEQKQQVILDNSQYIIVGGASVNDSFRGDSQNYPGYAVTNQSRASNTKPSTFYKDQEAQPSRDSLISGFSYKSLKESEVYNFSISFLTEFGQTGFYHIPATPGKDIGFVPFQTTQPYPLGKGLPTGLRSFHQVEESVSDRSTFDFLQSITVSVDSVTLPTELQGVIYGYVLSYQERNDSNIRWKGQGLVQKAYINGGGIDKDYVSEPVISDSVSITITNSITAATQIANKTAFIYGPDFDLNRLTINPGTDFLKFNSHVFGLNKYVYQKLQADKPIIGTLHDLVSRSNVAPSELTHPVTAWTKIDNDTTQTEWPNLNGGVRMVNIGSGFNPDQNVVGGTVNIELVNNTASKAKNLIQTSLPFPTTYDYVRTLASKDSDVNRRVDIVVRNRDENDDIAVHRTASRSVDVDSSDEYEPIGETSEYIYDIWTDSNDDTLYSDFESANYVVMGYRDLVKSPTISNTVWEQNRQFRTGDIYVDTAFFEKSVNHVRTLDGEYNIDGFTMLSLELFRMPTQSRYTNLRSRYSYPGSVTLFPFNTILANTVSGDGILFRNPSLNFNIEYNIDYNFKNNFSGAVPEYLKDNTGYVGEGKPYRLAYSLRFTEDAPRELFRKFLGENTYLMSFDTGAINNFFVNRGIFFVHTEGTIYQTYVDAAITGQTGTANVNPLLGTNEYFNVRPIKIVDSDAAFYGGTIGVYGHLETPIGYFFIDEYSQSLFLFNQTLRKLNANVMQEFFNNNITWRGNDHTGNWYNLGYDVNEDRLFFTKRFDADIIDLFEDEPNIVDPNKSFTLSYSQKLDAFESFQNFLPEAYWMNKGRFHAANVGQVNRYGVGIRGQYGDILNLPSTIKFIFRNPESQPLDYIRMFLTMVIKTQKNIPLDNKFFDLVRFSTEHQDTGMMPTINYNIDVDPISQLNKVNYTLFRDAHRIVLPETPYLDADAMGDVPLAYSSNYNYQTNDDENVARVLNGKYLIVYLYFRNEYDLVLKLENYSLEVKKQGI